MKTPTWLTKPFILAVHQRLCAEHGGSPRLRDGGLLDSALARPKNAFAYEKPSLFKLAALYAHGLARNHPFVDGFVAAVTFLDLNGIEFSGTEVDATLEMLDLAAGRRTVSELETWLERNCPGKRPRVKPRRKKSR